MGCPAYHWKFDLIVGQRIVTQKGGDGDLVGALNAHERGREAENDSDDEWMENGIWIFIVCRQICSIQKYTRALLV